jgi:hypothetical protein
LPALAPLRQHAYAQITMAECANTPELREAMATAALQKRIAAPVEMVGRSAPDFGRWVVHDRPGRHCRRGTGSALTARVPRRNARRGGGSWSQLGHGYFRTPSDIPTYVRSRVGRASAVAGTTGGGAGELEVCQVVIVGRHTDILRRPDAGYICHMAYLGRHPNTSRSTTTNTRQSGCCCVDQLRTQHIGDA